ncbi:MAG: RHS repeat-associated core domain-containing protein, partial [Gammaproteobacteria bacterium]
AGSELHLRSDWHITRIADDALPTLFFANQQVDPVGLYTYDAVYRLIEAQGRESIGQSALQLGLPQAAYRDYPYAGLGPQPSDPKAVRNYIDQYHYDEVGNFLHMIHQAQNGAWGRDYRYEEHSLVEPGKFSNRLSGTVLHPNGSQPIVEPYTHDAHGNMTAMPHLTLMEWDFKDQLQATARQVVNDGTPETTYYVYDAAGQRARKVTERQNGTRKNERTYLGEFEVFREYGGDGTGLSLEREALHVMDDQQRIALVETRTQGNDGSPAQLIRFQFSNHLGSASLELDDAGQIISYEEYFPYGSTSYQAVNKNIKAAAKRYRYTGKERDEETGFSYHGARYYAPWLGRWASCDPSGLVDGANLFAYVASNPLRHVDPSGTDKKPPKLNDAVPYDEKIENRDALGCNVQKDHIICQGKQRLINPDIDRSKQLTVAVETGAATNSAPAKPHTVVTFHDPQSDVKEINRLRELKPGDWTSFEREIVSPSLESRYRAGYPQSATNIAALDEIGSMFEVDQPNRSPNAARVELDWTARTEPVGPTVDPKTGLVAPKETKRALASHTPLVSPPRRIPIKPFLASGAKTALRKVIPGAGNILGLESAESNLEEGNYVSAGLDLIGQVPGYGDIVDMGRFFYALIDRPFTRNGAYDREHSLGTDQSLMKGMGGCQRCHTTVAVDNWTKTTPGGRMYRSLNGPAISPVNDLARDNAIRAWVNSAER